MRLALKEFYRILKKNGRLIVIVPGDMYRNIYDSILEHRERTGHDLSPYDLPRQKGKFKCHQFSKRYIKEIFNFFSFKILHFHNTSFLGTPFYSIENRIAYDNKINRVLETLIRFDLPVAECLPLYMGFYWIIVGEK